MPTYKFDEDVLREYAGDNSQEMDLSGFVREESGELSQYEDATCALDSSQFETISQTALQQLRRLAVTQIFVRYDGGYDEGFAYFEEAKTSSETLLLPQLTEILKDGPLGEKSPQTRIHYAGLAEKSRPQYVEEALEVLIEELTCQLLGGRYGTGEYSLEGRFIADLMANRLIDLPATGT